MDWDAPEEIELEEVKLPEAPVPPSPVAPNTAAADRPATPIGGAAPGPAAAQQRAAAAAAADKDSAAAPAPASAPALAPAPARPQLLARRGYRYRALAEATGSAVQMPDVRADEQAAEGRALADPNQIDEIEEGGAGGGAHEGAAQWPQPVAVFGGGARPGAAVPLLGRRRVAPLALAPAGAGPGGGGATSKFGPAQRQKGAAQRTADGGVADLEDEDQISGGSEDERSAPGGDGTAGCAGSLPVLARPVLG
jgi:hypothetical protein